MVKNISSNEQNIVTRISVLGSDSTCDRFIQWHRELPHVDENFKEKTSKTFVVKTVLVYIVRRKSGALNIVNNMFSEI